MKRFLLAILIIALSIFAFSALFFTTKPKPSLSSLTKLNQVNLKGVVPNSSEVPENQSELNNKVNLPNGFTIDYFAKDVNGARSLATNDKGLVFVGSRQAGKVYVLEDLDNNQSAENTVIIAKNLNNPNGVAFYNGDLYVAEINRILKFENIEETYKNNPQFTVINDSYPSEEAHGWKYIAIGPDNKLYVPVGAPCNVCESDSPFSSITAINLDGSGFNVVATGIRNTVGFTWDIDGDLWFTENGRDWFGDDIPPDELNVVTNYGQNFGFPYCHGLFYLDDKFGSEGDCDKYTKPVIELGPHVAALGLKFAPKNYPEPFKNKIFIAEHGSWNRSTPIGYRVTMVGANQQNNTAENYEVFASGWLDSNGNSWGRPVDILFLQDNTMLVSDDKANVVYKISYKKPSK
jgi:glucose/arabinose dehydrogenase